MKHHVDITKTITHVSLCAGYGGIDLGLRRAIPNLRTVAFSEIEGFAAANLVSKMESGLLDAAPIWTDVKTFPWSDFRDRVGILSGGYPCQPFSAAGKRLGKEDPRHLWPWIADGIVSMRPRIVFFENVEGHISLGLREVIEDLERIGYKATWGIFSASEVGAPHQRKRVFILAHDINRGRLPDWISRGLEGIRGREKDNAGSSSQPDSQLAHLIDKGSQGWLHRWSDSQRQGINGYAGCSSSSSRVWPSRPGQPQHEWEPPRVVGDTDSRRLSPSINPRGSKEAHCRGQDDIKQANGSAVGNAIMHGHATSEISGSTSQSKAQGRLQELEGRSPSVGNTSNWCNGQQPTEQQGRNTSGRSSEERTDVGNTTKQGLPFSGGECGAVQQSRSEQESERSDQDSNIWKAKSSMGGDSDESTNWMDYAELFVTSDNRTDELRLLGNGVVPATAERAFIILSQQLNHNQ